MRKRKRVIFTLLVVLAPIALVAAAGIAASRPRADSGAHEAHARHGEEAPGLDGHDAAGPREAGAGEGSEGNHLHREEAGDAHDHGNDGEDHSRGEEDDGDGHDEYGEAIVLSERERASLELRIVEAATGSLTTNLKLPAEVRLNEDRVVHVTPRLSGIVVDVRSTVGDTVTVGDALAVLESRDLADAKADCLAAHAHLALAEKTFLREKDLWEKQISAEGDYLTASRDLEEARIRVRSADQKLEALGAACGRSLRGASPAERSLTRYEITAPLDGEIIEKHIVLGEFLNGESVAFVLADLTTVWVDINVYQQDLPRIEKGKPVVLAGPAGLPSTSGAISYVSPVVDRETRTAVARVVLANKEGMWRPGLFLDVLISFDTGHGAVVVPKSAVQRIGEETVMFVEDPPGFRALPVSVGQENGDSIEILSGLAPGDRYVAEGAFELKAKLVAAGLGSHAGHGH